MCSCDGSLTLDVSVIFLCSIFSLLMALSLKRVFSKNLKTFISLLLTDWTSTSCACDIKHTKKALEGLLVIHTQAHTHTPWSVPSLMCWYDVVVPHISHREPTVEPCLMQSHHSTHRTHTVCNVLL